MKIQFLNGGLANQAFQYIFARYYELTYPGESMYMDDTYFALNTVHNGYELEKVFGIRPHMLSQCFDEEVWNFIISEVGDEFRNFNPFDGEVKKISCNKYIPQVLTAEGDVYYHGYWINKHWFDQYRETFLKEFTFPDIPDQINRERMKEIRESRSVSVHIRRGDYVDMGRALTPDFYREVTGAFMKKFGSDWELFVFSDDMAWCMEYQRSMGFQYFRKVHFIDGNTKERSYIDMQLMSQCRGMILSGSAFCYLAALLNTRREAFVNPTIREL